jgi:hypothetical protein
VATGEPGRVAKYATSTKHIVGMILAVGGPVLALTGVVAAPVGLALTPVLYAIGALVAPSRRRVNVTAGIDPHDVRRSLDEIQRRIYGRVPSDIGRKVAALAKTITELLPRADALGAVAQHVLVRSATDYLPTSLQAYLDLPRAYADRQVVADGKTPLQLLSEQLDVLSRQIDQVAAAVNRADTDKLIAHGRFLAEKFGHGTLDIGRDEE